MNEMDNQQNNKVDMIVVEAYTPDPEHMVVCAREKDNQSWHFFYAKTPNRICFGSHLFFDSSTGSLHLNYGPRLQYRVFCVDFPPEMLAEIMLRQPDFDVW